MTEEAKLIEVNQAIEYLREDACGSCIFNSFIGECTSILECRDRKAADLIESLSAELEQVKQERDAAVKDLRTFTEPCRACAHVGSNDICHECGFELIEGHHITRTNWQWRGVKEEE